MGELRDGMRRLGGSVSTYQLELLKLNAKVCSLNRSSRQLQDWAERAGSAASS